MNQKWLDGMSHVVSLASSGKTALNAGAGKSTLTGKQNFFRPSQGEEVAVTGQRPQWAQNC